MKNWQAALAQEQDIASLEHELIAARNIVAIARRLQDEGYVHFKDALAKYDASRSKPYPSRCRRCGQPPAYAGAVYCGAACSQLAEEGK